MANSHPYISGPKNIAAMVQQLRKSFPPSVTSETVKKLGLASNNESYVINALQFVDIIDEEGRKTDRAAQVFSLHKDEDFQPAFKEMLEKSYEDLFNLHGQDAWELSREELITYFRQTDQTSQVIGGRQAGTFLVLAALAGFGEIPTLSKPKSPAAKPKPAPKTASPKISNATSIQTNSVPTQNSPVVSTQNSVGLSVRIEINLPSDATAETYDNIFKSIRKNLINE